MVNAIESVNGARMIEAIPPEVASHAGLVQINIRFSGVTPLLMNAMSEEQLLAIRDKKKAPKTAARPSLRDEAASKVHQLPDGSPVIPLQALYATFINAGQFIRLDGKRQITTEKKTILPGMLTILDKTVSLVKAGAVEKATWEVDIQQGRNPNGGEAVCLVRPRFDDWSFSCTVEVDQQQMPLSMARELVDLAGKRIGLLEYRPQRKGTFGRFEVVEWNILRAAR